MLALGLLSYGLAAAGFLVLTLLLLTSWEGRSEGARLIVACAVTAVWALLLAVGAQFARLTVSLVLLIEFLRYGAWFFALTGLTRTVGLARRLSMAVHCVWIGGALLVILAPLLEAFAAGGAVVLVDGHAPSIGEPPPAGRRGARP